MGCKRGAGEPEFDSMNSKLILKTRKYIQD